MANAPKHHVSKFKSEKQNKRWLLRASERYLPSGPDDKRDLSLSLNVEVSSLLGGTLGIDESLVGISVLLGVLGGIIGGDLASCGAGSLIGGALIGQGLKELGVSLLLLEDVLRNGGRGAGSGLSWSGLSGGGWSGLSGGGWCLLGAG